MKAKKKITNKGGKSSEKLSLANMVRWADENVIDICAAHEQSVKNAGEERREHTKLLLEKANENFQFLLKKVRGFRKYFEVQKASYLCRSGSDVAEAFVANSGPRFFALGTYGFTNGGAFAIGIIGDNVIIVQSEFSRDLKAFYFKTMGWYETWNVDSEVVLARLEVFAASPKSMLTDLVEMFAMMKKGRYNAWNGS